MDYDEEAARKFNADVGKTSLVYYWPDGTPGLPYDVMRAWSKDHHIETTFVGSFRVSTIWLFMDHGYHWLGEPEPPLIFETMVFPQGEDEPAPFGSDAWHELECQRYSSEAEARAGHELIVAQLRQLVEEITVDPDPSRSADAGE